MSKSISDLINDSYLEQKEMPKGVEIKIEKPNVLSTYMKHFLGDRPLRVHPAYRQVAEWLNNNQGKGLFLHGVCSQGKTFIARYVLPAILLNECNKVCHFYTMYDANKNPDEVMSHHIIAIDDVGTEDQSVQYGNRRNVFNEIMDEVERKGKLAIVTSNLQYSDIKEKYGERTYERMKACLKDVEFNLRDNNNNPISFRY